jgi:hypothetical protein
LGQAHTTKARRVQGGRGSLSFRKFSVPGRSGAHAIIPRAHGPAVSRSARICATPSRRPNLRMSWDSCAPGCDWLPKAALARADQVVALANRSQHLLPFPAAWCRRLLKREFVPACRGPYPATADTGGRRDLVGVLPVASHLADRIVRRRAVRRNSMVHPPMMDGRTCHAEAASDVTVTRGPDPSLDTGLVQLVRVHPIAACLTLRRHGDERL